MTYFQSDRDLHTGSRALETQLHKVRDGLALMMTVATLYEEGWTYAGTIMNYPTELRYPANKRFVQTCLDISPEDVIIQLTRPPINEDTGARRAVRASGSEIETTVFEAFKVFLSHCSRSRVTLKSEVLEDLERKQRCWSDIRFQQYQGARVRYLKGKREPDDERLTVTYMVSVPGAGPNGAHLLASFGMGGTETLVAATLVREDSRWRNLLREMLVAHSPPRLVLTKFLVPGCLPEPYLDLALSDLCPEVMVDITLP
jgi:hypothetical protein